MTTQNVKSFFGNIIPKPIQRFWHAFSHVLAWVNIRIILGILYFVVLTPIALIRRMLGQSSLPKPDENAKSYRIASTPTPATQLEKPF